MNNQSPFGTLGQQTAATTHNSRFSSPTYLIRRKIMKLLGAAFFVEAPEGSVILYCELKAFKLKEDIRLYTGQDKTTEVLRIGARKILDVSATYDVYDSATNEKIGALRRKGLKSMLRDEWEVLDVQDRSVGTIQEDSMILALIRRFIDLISLLLPQKYTVKIGEQEVGTYAQTFNPFVSNIRADFSRDTQGLFDRRLGVAAAILMAAIEGKQG